MNESSENSQQENPEEKGAEKGEEYLTPKEVGLLWKVNGKTVKRWAIDGKLPFVKSPSGRMRFRRSDVMKGFEVSNAHEAE